MKKLLCLFIIAWGVPLMASELLNTINQERVKRRLPALKEKAELTCAAVKHSKDIGTRRVCSHTGKDGSNAIKRIASCGLTASAWGEIVACGQTTPRAAVNAWIKSPSHNAIMFSSSYRYFGGGMTNNYWTVVFTK
jgi:uncharacterized protein YkwD